MAEKSTEKNHVINVARTQWRGDEVAYRVGRVIAKVKVERGKPDPERVRRIADELAGELPDARVLRVSAGTGDHRAHGARRRPTSSRPPSSCRAGVTWSSPGRTG